MFYSLNSLAYFQRAEHKQQIVFCLSFHVPWLFHSRVRFQVTTLSLVSIVRSERLRVRNKSRSRFGLIAQVDPKGPVDLQRCTLVVVVVAVVVAVVVVEVIESKGRTSVQLTVHDQAYTLD